jgi:ribonucleoside-diphosphate reductase alpha chain
LALTENAIKVLKSRILRKNEQGEVIEIWFNAIGRVAKAIAMGQAEHEREFCDLMDNLYFLPNSPCLANAGTKMQQLQACFVLPIEDNMESIFQTLKDMSLIFKSGGGVGFSISRMRPEGDIVHSTSGQSSGPISFLEPYNAAINTVKQGGRRRGAALACMRVDHPDILSFIDAKRDGAKLTNFNLSVAITDKFMEAVKNGNGFDLINPRNGDVVETIPARTIWDKIIEGAWHNGEPGILFIDEINKHNPLPELGEIESPNACSEFYGLPYESCNLGSINLAKMVTKDIVSPSNEGGFEYTVSKGNFVNWRHIKDTVRTAVRFLDNILDVTEYPLEQIRDMSLGNRKIGLGVMGWGDMLFKLGIPYDSEEALEAAWKIMGTINDEAFYASGKLAKEKGAFPNWHISPSFQETYGKVRNATQTCIAPTGTLSIIANCTSGIEPAYGLVYEKHVLDGETLYEVNPVFEAALKEYGIYSEELLQKVADNKGSCRGIKEIPADMQKVFVTAHDITPEWHVSMQAKFQRQVNMGISKTVNLPHDATVEDVDKVYQLAYDLGCKGLTVYRDGSRNEQVLSSGKPAPNKVEVRPRPYETAGITTRLKTGCGKLYATINEDDHGVCEVLLNQRDGNGCRVAYNNALAMVSSMALRAGVSISDISRALKGQSCGKPVWDNGKLILSCPDAIGKHLDEEQEFQEFKVQIEPGKVTGAVKLCACGGVIISQGGCDTCRDCGSSNCGG